MGRASLAPFEHRFRPGPVEQVVLISSAMNDQKRAQLEGILQCQHCGAKDSMRYEALSVRCSLCNVAVALKNGAACFYEGPLANEDEAGFQIDQFSNRGFVAGLFNQGQRLINSDYTPTNQLTAFLSATRPDEVIVELGSGHRNLLPQIINVDLFPFANVDIVSDVARVPFKDESVDAAVLDTMLEHVPEPHVVVNELHRILKPGGRAVCFAPFIFPYHAYPKHYFNISKDGLEFLFRNFSSCKVEMNVGPTAALTNLISEYFASAAPSKNQLVYTLAKGMGLAPIFLFKYLDKLWERNPESVRISSILCAQVIK
jgi:SAM-dependent methyltransferase